MGFSEEAISKRINSMEKSSMDRELITKEERDAITASVEAFLKKWAEGDSD